jgi:hypothetical protein
MDTVGPAGNAKRAGNCLWATPTLFLAAPVWFNAEAFPWTCLRDADPHCLATTERCEACPRWERVEKLHTQ